MFDDLIREARRLEEGLEIPVSIALDADGYGDRECPKEECRFGFKVEWNDWRDKVPEHIVHCPSCGYTAESGSWNTPEQVEHFERTALSAIGERFGRAMERDAARWNRQQAPGGLVQITMSVRTPHHPILLPPDAADSIRLKIVCSQCSCRYAVIEAAFFCPACGHNDVERVFDEALDNATRTLDVIPTIRLTIQNRETAEATVRSLTEHALLSAVTAFQKYSEHLYARLNLASTPRRNTFQSIDAGSRVWESATEIPYKALLQPTELAMLNRAFQQRHLVAHTQGVVDAAYIARSGDTSWRVGQRLVVRSDYIRQCIAVIRKLAVRLARATSDLTRSHDDAVPGGAATAATHSANHESPATTRTPSG